MKLEIMKPRRNRSSIGTSSSFGFDKEYDWGLYPQAERLLHIEVERFISKNSFARSFSKKMWDKTSTRFFDWIDHIVVPESRIRETALIRLGFSELNVETQKGTRAFKHSGTIFFPVVLTEGREMEVVIKTENIDHCVIKLNKKAKILGKKYSPYSKAILSKQGNYILSAAERRGYSGFMVPDNVKDVDKYNRALKIFAKRERKFVSDEKGMIYIEKLIKKVKKVMKKLSKSRTADAFFRNERLYWESRNTAGRIQKKRQNILGLGWGNHDHHTYRSSRENFARLISIFEILGFLCRERFYAGPVAGWGAQIMEHPDCDIVLFADVDITDKERNKDFAHKDLKPTRKLGTVGLWVGLHGESILQAGMHHLEARFDFEKLRNDLPKYGANVMNPFSYFSFLKQAFTEGEKWKVEKKRLNLLLEKGLINKTHYQNFLRNGAIGSHMENLQRSQGFKGFNQDSVTAIIKATDPRKYLHQTHKTAA